MSDSIFVHCNISKDLMIDRYSEDVKSMTIKQCRQHLDKQLDDKLKQCLSEYATRYNILLMKDVMVVLDSSGVSYIDTKHDREILYHTFPNCIEKIELMHHTFNLSIMIRKNYD